MQRHAVVAFRRPARGDDDDVLRLVAEVAQRLGARAEAVARYDLATGRGCYVPAKEDAAVQIVGRTERIEETDGGGQIEVGRHDDKDAPRGRFFLDVHKSPIDVQKC